MATLFDKIEYEEALYSELTDTRARQAIEELAANLKHLENEIINDPEGSITMTKEGNVYTVGFEQALSDKIAKIINARD